MSLDPSTVGSFLLEVSLRSAVAALVVALLLRVCRIGAPTLRHLAWTTVLGAMLLMPLLSSIVPSLPLPLPAAISPPPVQVALDKQWAAPRPAPVPMVVPSAREPVIVTEASPTVPARPARNRVVLASVATYLAGVVFFLARLVSGWIAAKGMTRRARATAVAGVCESREVAAPVTVGILRPVIVLPAAWRTWPEEKLDAVLAHETAHVTRRDPIIALAARINRVLFWFHPLAWWLERQLAVTAEHACDEAAARVVAEPSRYAEILLEIADAVRVNRGRVVWQAIGVNGGGQLEARIERVLRGSDQTRLSRATQAGVLLACISAVLLVVACRKAPVPPLEPDPDLSRQLAEEDTRMKKFESIRGMTQADADALEQRLVANPQDFDTRERLTWYYTTSRTVPWDKKVPGLRRHALWLIEHAPEHDVPPPALSPRYDPEGFAAAKTSWEAHLARPDVSPFVVYRAARFFAPNDKAYAEKLILRGLEMDPDSAALKARMPPRVVGYQWRSQLANLYAAALFGSESMWGTADDLRIRTEMVNDPFAAEVRRKLEASADAQLLANVGSMLARPRGPAKDEALDAAQTRARDLGVAYLRRALALDPTLENAKTSLYVATAAETLTEADRLANRAHERFTISEDITEYVKNDAAKARSERDEARQDALRVLEMAKAHAGDPQYSAAVMTAHQVLASVALRDGDRDNAIDHLRQSVTVPTSERIQYAPPFAWGRVVNRLLKEGERERVVEFLEAYARLTVRERQRLLDDAQAIRAGRMPLGYQRMMNREWNQQNRKTSRRTIVLPTEKTGVLAEGSISGRVGHPRA